MHNTVQDLVLLQDRNFAKKSAQIWFQHVPLILTKKTSIHTLSSWP